MLNLTPVQRVVVKSGTFLIILVLITLAFIFAFNPTAQPPNPRLEARNKVINDALQNDRSLKTILLWNNFFSEKHFRYGVGRSPFTDAGCEVDKCVMWDQQDGPSALAEDQFDAVVFHALDAPAGVLRRDAPKTRSPHQRYIFFLLEAPSTNTFNFTCLDGFFNWTITYRRDSDIYFPYGFIGNTSTMSKYLNPTPNQLSPNSWLQPIFNPSAVPPTSKTKLVAWFVSNCATPSRRELYVKKLSEYVSVDVYGNCGTHYCPRTDTSQCLHMLEETYKFYLAFENSLCQDYVTEKLFLYMEYNIVPVVYGGVNYKEVAPPMSYIDVNDFDSPQDLANYLLYLDNNPKEYDKYFWWKFYYNINRGINHVLCSLCKMLHNSSLPGKAYNIQSWWNAPEVCRKGQLAKSHSNKLPYNTIQYLYLVSIYTISCN